MHARADSPARRADEGGASPDVRRPPSLGPPSLPGTPSPRADSWGRSSPDAPGLAPAPPDAPAPASLGLPDDEPAPSPRPASAASSASWISVNFANAAEEERFLRVCRALWLIGYAYLFTASCSFFSSLYPAREPARATPPASVDAFLVTSSIVAIDLCSALFVICGFMAAYAHANMTSADWYEFSKIVALYVLVDLWLSTAATLLVGSIFHLAKHSFRLRDLALTLLNGATGLRVFEFRQDWRAWHDMNPTAWVVPSLLYCLLLLPLSTRTNVRLRALWSGGGDMLALANAVLPLVVIGLFALVRDDTNVFFANSANLGYRLLEFNLGACLYTLSLREDRAQRVLRKMFAVLQRVSAALYFLFAMIWWSELGAPAPASADKVCVRMYSFSPCIAVHHGFLMRGCLLGVVFIATVLEAPAPELPTARSPPPPARGIAGDSMAPVLSSILFVWPTCYVVELLLEMNFSTALAHEHAMLLVFVVPHISLGVAFVWEETGKKRAYAACEAALYTLEASCARWWAASRLRPWCGACCGA